VPAPWQVVVVGLVLMLAFDLAPISWAGVLVAVVALALAWGLVRRWARSREWSWRHIAALAYGGVLARSLVAFLAPVPVGVEPSAKYAQNVVLLVLVVALGVALRRASTTVDAPSHVN
jgi:phosphatidylserine synthase